MIETVPTDRWSKFKAPPFSKTQPMTGNMCCTNGHWFSLIDHQISPDGKVLPSVVCPEIVCEYHEFVILEGWLDDD